MPSSDESTTPSPPPPYPLLITCFFVGQYVDQSTLSGFPLDFYLKSSLFTCMFCSGLIVLVRLCSPMLRNTLKNNTCNFSSLLASVDIEIFRISNTRKFQNLCLLQVPVVYAIPCLYYSEEITFASTNRDLGVLAKEKCGQIFQDSVLEPQMISVCSHI